MMGLYDKNVSICNKKQEIFSYDLCLVSLVFFSITHATRYTGVGIPRMSVCASTISVVCHIKPNHVDDHSCGQTRLTQFGHIKWTKWKASGHWVVTFTGGRKRSMECTPLWDTLGKQMGPVCNMTRVIFWEFSLHPKTD